MNIAPLLATTKTVFTVQQIGQLLGVTNTQVLRNQLTRRKQHHILNNITRGIRALPNYSTHELANVLMSPSYISLETVLSQAGVVFQYYGTTIFSVTTNTKSFVIDDTHYTYHKIASRILLNPQGIKHQDHIARATVERAICDRLYLTPGYHFDNLRSVNRTRLFMIAEIYENKRMLLDLRKLHHDTGY